ncbi:MAG: AlpA family phage regulatory protein [Methylococcaceae bacterium]|nr:AlpA family phage regulatory protein [Methylococcaceae bacterium]MDP3903616.1 AlpA family phage regulatory protein [Methylococcaceae bacterium]
MQQHPTQTTATDPLKAGNNLRVSALAPRLGISKNTVWRLVREGKFPKPIKLSTKISVWKADDVLAWLASKEAV